jgi:hypothetical protein
VAGSRACSDCRVALVTEPPPRSGLQPAGQDLIELGRWPRLHAQILRRRLETAGVTVMAEWSEAGPDATGVLIVPDPQAEFAEAVVNEIDVDDEVPDTSPPAYLDRIEEHLSAAAELLAELRTRLEDDDPG